MNMRVRFQGMATRLITQVFGSIAQPVVIRRSLYSNYDEAAGSIISAHEDYDVTGIVGPWQDDNSAALNSDQIITHDLYLLISAETLEITPVTGVDTVIIDSVEYSIVRSETDEAAATIKMRLVKELEQ